MSACLEFHGKIVSFIYDFDIQLDHARLFKSIPIPLYQSLIPSIKPPDYWSVINHPVSLLIRLSGDPRADKLLIK